MWVLAVPCIAVKIIHWSAHHSHYNCYLYHYVLSVSLIISYLALLAWLKLSYLYCFPEDYIAQFFLIHCKENVSLKLPFSSTLILLCFPFNSEVCSTDSDQAKEVLCSLHNCLNPSSQLVKHSCSHVVDHLSTQCGLWVSRAEAKWVQQLLET